MEYYFLAFPGNPGIKEESRVPDQSQKVKAFLHLRESPESVENCFLAFQAFPGIPGKARGAWTLLDFPTFFLAFPYVQKILQSQEFSAKIDPGEFRTPFSTVNPNKKPKCHNSRNFDG